MSAIHRTLADLVAIPSVTGSEGRICTALAERLLPLWTMEHVQRIGNSLVVGRRGEGRPLIALYGHTDTVPAQGNATARVEEGRMYGLGTSDMKGGLAVMVHLLEDEDVHVGPYDVVGVFYDKEEGPADENGLEEVLDRAPWLAEAEFSIVLEPTDLQLELGCNGAINAEIVFEGRSAHSARPWHGLNAVTKAGAWLAAMHERQPERVEIAGLEFHEVFAVTSAAGGIANNIIPGEFRVNLNHRFPPIYTIEQAEERLRAVATAADRVVIKDRAPAGRVPEHNSHLERLETVAAAGRLAKQGWTDVARLTERGIPAVNFGPGEVAQAHQVGESIPLANLDRAFEVLRRFLTS